MTAPLTPFPIGSARPGSGAQPALHPIERLGADACPDDVLFAALLGDGRSALRTARRLLDDLGSIDAALTAEPGELRAAGLRASVSIRLAAAVELSRRAAWAGRAHPSPVRTPADAAEPLVDAMGSLEREELRVLLLDTKNVVTARRTVYRGNLAGSSVRVGEVFRDAVRTCAAAVIVVHNHPSGDPSPSSEDLRITAELADAGRLLDVDLLDHIVIGRGRWVSLRSLGALDQPPGTRR